MDSLSARQAEKLQQQVAGHMAYLQKLIGRMEAFGFSRADRFHVSASKALSGLSDLHQLACIRAGTVRRRSGKSCPKPPRTADPLGRKDIQARTRKSR